VRFESEGLDKESDRIFLFTWSGDRFLTLRKLANQRCVVRTKTPYQNLTIMNLHRFSSSSPDGSAQLRTWISHTVPHMTLVSLTTDTVPGLWLFAAGCIGIASIVVIGRTLREVSAAQRLCSPAVELPKGMFV